MFKIVTNKIRCKYCGDIVISETRHDFKMCRCGKCGTDGGNDYIRRVFDGDDPDAIFEDKSLYLNTETGKLVEAKDINPDYIPVSNAKEKPEEQPVPTLDIPETKKKAEPEEHTTPTIDISEVTEAVEAEPVKSEERALQNEDKLKKKAKQVARIKELKAEGKTFYDISKELNLPEATVRQYFKQNA